MLPPLITPNISKYQMFSNRIFPRGISCPNTWLRRSSEFSFEILPLMCPLLLRLRVDCDQKVC